MTRSRSTKTFVQFEREHSHLKGTALKQCVQARGRIAPEDIVESNHFAYDDLKFPRFSNLTQAEIHSAVYVVESADKWQQFRVSLKGLTINEKLYCLMSRWIHHSWYLDSVEKEYEIVRIQNYLGALIRSGHLNSSWHAVH